MAGKIGSRNAPMPKNCRARSEMSAPTTPIQLRATWVPVSTEALLSEGSSGEYEASERKRRSAETHSRKPISSFSRRLPVGTNILARKRMWAVSSPDEKPSRGANRPEPHYYAKKRTLRQCRNRTGVLSWLPGSVIATGSMSAIACFQQLTTKSEKISIYEKRGQCRAEAEVV